MEHNNHNNTFTTILDKIKKNEIKVKPKTYFRLRMIALACVSVAIIVIAILLSSFLMFTLRMSGHASLIGFGPSGWQVFLMLFPWKLFTLEILLVFLLEWMLRNFKFGYRIPVLYLLGIVLMVTIVSGIAVDKFKLHDELMFMAGKKRLPPPFVRIYNGVGELPPPPMGHGISRGIISSVSTSSIMVIIDNPKDRSTSSIEVILPPNFDSSSVGAGDRIFIRGEMIGDKIEAQDIRKPFRR